MKNEKGNALLISVIILVAIGIFGIYVFSKYNSIVTSEENISSKWSQVENQLQRRFDLIPNLVNTAKGYAAHEEEIFLKLAEARSEYGSAKSIEDVANANDELSQALSNLFVVVENYPELKSNEQFNMLMTELAGTENRIAVARKDYNEAVQEYNSTIRRFPGSIIANMFDFELKTYFEVQEGIEEVPTIQFEDE
ncbi:LemA family protein [Ureibacillus endophyticus]|uniref:LemA family protein n=1 Tax=Ureibacillus endophyticus TaxID=1978490 RepID=A0A494Z2E4_9BACL|nr:LemA family protein [Lysinibacillus endophyticus]RKQ16663.1 LemA family protein [Lysinibacillus endophyticus]